MILDKSTLDSIEKNKGMPYEKVSEKVKEKLWDAVRKEITEALEELKEQIGTELYENWIKQVKEENSEYYALSYFRDISIDKLQRQSILLLLYKHGIVVSDIPTVRRELNKKIEENCYLDILAVLKKVTMFCVAYNRGGTHVADILHDVYDVPKEIGNELVRVFDDNKLSLKMDYLIRMLRSKDDE